MLVELMAAIATEARRAYQSGPKRFVAKTRQCPNALRQRTSELLIVAIKILPVSRELPISAKTHPVPTIAVRLLHYKGRAMAI